MNEQKVPILTVAQLAAKAGVSSRNIRHLLQKGTLSGFKLNDSIWVIPREEANRYLEHRKGRKRADFGRKHKSS